MGPIRKKQLFFVVHVTRRPCSACCFFFCMARLNKLMVCVCERNYRDRLRIYKTHVICRYTSAVNPTFCSRSLKIISIIQLYNIINIVYIQTRNYRNYVYRMACLMIVRYLLEKKTSYERKPYERNPLHNTPQGSGPWAVNRTNIQLWAIRCYKAFEFVHMLNFKYII